MGKWKMEIFITERDAKGFAKFLEGTKMFNDIEIMKTFDNDDNIIYIVRYTK